MAAEWYYTTNKQQMGPVTWEELRELAEAGIIKAHDMVWSEGMDEWVKAINQKGLFGDDDGIEEETTAKKKKAKPPPGRRKSADEEDEEDEEDEREAKKKARKAEQERAKMGIWIKVGLIVGGIVLLLVLCVTCGVSLFFMGIFGGGGGGGEKVRESYTINNLPGGRDHTRDFRFTQGRRVVITVTNDIQFPNTDVDLFVVRGNQQIAADIRIPAQDRNCRVEFRVPASDSYRVIVRNLGPGMARRCDVRIEEN